MNQQSLYNARQMHSDLWAIKDILSIDQLQYILSEINQEQNWEKVDKQKNSNRQQIVWKKDGICDWLWCKLAELDFSNFGFKFRTVMIWKDEVGYTIGDHCDNDRVEGAMQIYLSKDNPGLGTWFENRINIPFLQNTGYFMDNRNKLIHGMRQTVPKDYTRLSFYALFDRQQ